jgi:hypothetical protein
LARIPELLVLSVLSLAAACGYRPAGTTLPGGVRSVQVLPPGPHHTDEPLLAQLLTSELIRKLEQHGARASAAADQTRARLRTRIISLRTIRATIAPRTASMAGQSLRLQLELTLLDRDGRTLWRSGLLELDQHYPVSAPDSLATEESRRQALHRLAATAATEAVLLMTSGL